MCAKKGRQQNGQSTLRLTYWGRQNEEDVEFLTNRVVYKQATINATQKPKDA